MPWRISCCTRSTKSNKIRPSKGLQNGIENPTDFLEELNWAYRREYRDRATFQKTHRILFCSNLGDSAERWYSKLPAATKGDLEALRAAFAAAFQVEEVDHGTCIVELRLELANLKQGEIENIAEFIARADTLAKELPGSQVDVGMAVTRGTLDLEHKERPLFECVRSKSFTFGNIKTLAKALSFSRGKDNPFDLAYKELKSVGLPSPVLSTEELLRHCIPALVQGVRMSNSTLIHGPSPTFSSNPSYQRQYGSFQPERQGQYRDFNQNDDRCYVCSEPGHYRHQCRRERNQRQQPAQYSG